MRTVVALVALTAVGSTTACGGGVRLEPAGAPRQITDRSGVEDYPAWSPDGRVLAYAASERGDVFGGEWDIWTLDLVTGEAENLTADRGGDNRFPAWSPDGQRLAFWSDRNGGGYAVMSRDGLEVQRIETSPSVPSSAPAWSADGGTLAAVVRTPAGVALEFADLASGSRRAVSLPGRNTRRFDLAWSPDGRLVAYVDASSLTASVSQILVLDLQSGAERAVTDGTSSDASPAWAPDGSSLSFVSSRGGRRDVWVQSFVDGRPAGDPVRVTENVGIRHAAVSPHGARVAYSRGQTVANVWRVPILPDRPATWDDAERLTSSEGFIEYIDLGPDGRRLLLSSDQSGNPDAWVLNLDDGSLVQLTTDPGPQWGAVWSPDGESVALYDFRAGNRDLAVLPAAGGSIRAVSPHPAEDMYPAWSPDGETFAFYSVRTGNRDLFVIPTDGGDAVQLTTHDGDDLFPQWAPDGGDLAFYSDRSGEGRLWRLDPSGGEAAPLTSGPARFGRWAADGEWLYFTGWESRLGNLYGLSLADGTERPVTDLVGRPGSLGSYALAVGPSHLYFTWEENVGDLWIAPLVRPGAAPARR